MMEDNTTNNVAKLRANEEEKSEILAKVFLSNDLSPLSAKEKVLFMNEVCVSLGLNSLTRPFQLFKSNGKEVMYASKDCAEQLRRLNKVSLQIVDKRIEQDVYIVTARATLPDGRTDESTGAVYLGKNVQGDARCNAVMKAETKAKRRVTLSICGIGCLDESELDTIKDAQIVSIKPHNDNAKSIQHVMPGQFEGPLLEECIKLIEDAQDEVSLRQILKDAWPKIKLAENKAKLKESYEMMKNKMTFFDD